MENVGRHGEDKTERKKSVRVGGPCTEVLNTEWCRVQATLQAESANHCSRICNLFVTINGCCTSKYADKIHAASIKSDFIWKMTTVAALFITKNG